MKFFTYTLAIASLAGLSSTAAIDLSVVDKRSVATDEYALVSGVYNQVLDYDAHINQTVKGLNIVTVLLNPSTVASVRSDLKSITSLVNDAAAKAPTLGLTQRSLTLELEPRQITNETLDLADLLATLLTEVDNTINPLLENLGLGVLLTDLIEPLEDALVALVRGVGAVVDGLVAALLPILDALTKAVGSILGPILALLGL